MLRLIVLSTFVTSATCGGMSEFMEHAGAGGTQHGKDVNATDYWSSNSRIPILPFVSGYMGTHGTYRFLTVVEQTAIVIGEAKHGMWRVQENGYVREYRKKGAVGIKDAVDPNDPNLSANILDVIRISYSHYIPEESWSGYKYPDDRISNGKYDGLKDYLNFIDLSIYHPKYKGKYDQHVAIDLPYFYCTMTQNDYPYLNNVWKYALAQRAGNEMGPLAKRAGLDIKENYLNVLRLNFFEDAGIWANVGIGNETIRKVANLNDTKSKAQTVNYQRVDFSQMNVEVYLYERPFFNRPYIFVGFILENKIGPSFYSYVRNDGAYWSTLQQKRNSSGIPNDVQYSPEVIVQNYPSTGLSSTQNIIGLPVYGHHHPDRGGAGMNGGACPERGGDWGRYPWSNAGAGYPTNYEEVTPICDGMVMDVKLWKNLWFDTWEDVAFGLGNAGYGVVTTNYSMDANVYGKYTDPFLQGTVNPDIMVLTKDGKIVEGPDGSSDKVTLQLNFTRVGTYQEFNDLDLEKTTKCPVRDCPTPKCPTTECPASPTCPACVTTQKECKPVVVEKDNEIPNWAVAMLVICAVALFLIFINFVFFIVLSERIKRIPLDAKVLESGRNNPSYSAK